MSRPGSRQDDHVDRVAAAAQSSASARTSSRRSRRRRCRSGCAPPSSGTASSFMTQRPPSLRDSRGSCGAPSSKPELRCTNGPGFSTCGPARRTCSSSSAAGSTPTRSCSPRTRAHAGWRPLTGWLTNFGSYAVLTEPIPELLGRIGWTGGRRPATRGCSSTTSHDPGRPGPHGERLGADWRRRPARRARSPETGRRPSRAAAGLGRLIPELRRRADRARLGWADRRLGGSRPVLWDLPPAPGSTTRPGTRATAPARAGWRAQSLASLVTRANDEWTALPLVNRRPRRRLPPEPFRSLGGGLVRGAILREEAEDQGRRAPAHLRLVAGLPRALGLELGPPVSSIRLVRPGEAPISCARCS